MLHLGDTKRHLDSFAKLEAEFEYPIETHTMHAWGYLDELLNTENFCEGRGVKLVDVIVGK